MKQLRFSIIEMDEHSDGIDGHCEWLDGSGHYVTIYTTETAYNSLSSVSKNDAFKFVLKNKQTSKYKFLETHLKQINDSDVIFLNTINSDYNAYVNIKSTTGITILRVHNAHKHFKPFAHINIPLNPYLIWKFISYVVRELIIGKFNQSRKIINSNVDYFTFLLDSIKDYVIENNLAPKNKIGYILPQRPFRASNFTYKTTPDQSLNITIVGALDERRKFFEPIVDAMRIFFKTTTTNQIRLTLLGNGDSAYGAKIISELKNINPQLQITSFTAKVDQATFDEMLSKTDLLISPIRVNNITDIFKEQYGKTKFTGILGDLAMFPIPTIFPAEFRLNKGVLKHSFTYKNATELSSIIDEIIKDKNKLNINQKGISEYFAINFNKYRIRTEYFSFIESALQKKEKTNK